MSHQFKPGDRVRVRRGVRTLLDWSRTVMVIRHTITGLAAEIVANPPTEYSPGVSYGRQTRPRSFKVGSLTVFAMTSLEPVVSPYALPTAHKGWPHRHVKPLRIPG